jgi:hypothetical protein
MKLVDKSSGFSCDARTKFLTGEGAATRRTTAEVLIDMQRPAISLSQYLLAGCE